AAVERASTVGRRPAPALRALVRHAIGALLDEQHLDATVGGGLERLLPTGGRAAVPPRLLLPALDRLALGAPTRTLEVRPCDLEQPLGVRMRLRLRPADDRLPRLVRERALDVPAHLLRRA